VLLGHPLVESWLHKRVVIVVVSFTVAVVLVQSSSLANSHLVVLLDLNAASDIKIVEGAGKALRVDYLRLLVAQVKSFDLV